MSCDDFPQIPVQISNVLKPHQIKAVQFLLQKTSLHKKSLGCILADTPGAGKTLSVLAYMVIATEKLKNCKTLVVTPKSVLSHWAREADKWLKYWPGLWAKGTYVMESKFEQTKIKKWKIYGGLLIISYDTCLKLMESKGITDILPADVLVCDEAHTLKNVNSDTTTAVLRVQANVRILLTGTPVCNKIEELHSLLKFIDPEFISVQAFCARFSGFVEDDGYVSRACVDHQRRFHMQFQDLRSLVPNLVHRAFLENTEIPEKKDWIVYLELSHVQRQLYNAFVQFLFSALALQTRPYDSIMYIESKSDLLTFHPALVAVDDIELWTHAQSGRQMPPVLEQGAKLNVVVYIINHAFEMKKKVILFSKSLAILNLTDSCINKRIKRTRLDGSMSAKRRQKNIDQFNEDLEITFILVSKLAGSEGINLCRADIAIISEVDWNPLNDYQASLRAHRYGQENRLHIIRLVSTGTLDYHKLKVQAKKIKLASCILSETFSRTDEVYVQDTYTFLRKFMNERPHSQNMLTIESDEAVREISQILPYSVVDQVAVYFDKFVSTFGKRIQHTPTQDYNIVQCVLHKLESNMLYYNKQNGETIFLPRKAILKFVSNGQSIAIVLLNGIQIDILPEPPYDCIFAILKSNVHRRRMIRSIFAFCET